MQDNMRDQTAPVAAEAQKKPSILGLVLGVMSAPSVVIQQHLAHVSWIAAYGVSGLAYGLFFLQTGLDLARVGKMDEAGILALALTGVVFGTIGVMLLGAVTWMGAKIWGSTYRLPDALRAFGLAYSPTLVYALCGLAVNLALGWNTAVAFGVTGLLWALNPIANIIKQFTQEKTIPTVLLTTLCGVLMLIGWAYLGGAL